MSKNKTTKKDKELTTASTPQVEISSDILGSEHAPRFTPYKRTKKRPAFDYNIDETETTKPKTKSLIPDSSPPTTPTISTMDAALLRAARIEALGKEEEKQREYEEDVMEVEEIEEEIEEEENSPLGKLITSLLQKEMTKFNQKMTERNHYYYYYYYS